MCFVVFCKDFFQSFARLITVSCTSFYSHVDTAVRHKRSFQRFVCLKSDNLLQIFHAVINISGTICCQSGNNFCLHIQHSAFCTFFFLQLLQSSPQFVCCFCRSLQEGFVSFIWCVILLNEIAYIYGISPVFSCKAFPLLKIWHLKYLLVSSPFFFLFLYAVSIALC